MRKVKLKELCSYQNGFAFKSNYLEKVKSENSYLPVIKIGSFKENNIVINKCQYAKYSEYLKQYLIKNNDILIAMTGATVGKAVLIIEDNNYLLNQRVGIIRPKAELNLKYLFHNISDEKFYHYCQEIAGGGAQGNISHDQILDYEIPLPETYEEQIVIAEKLDKQIAEIEKMRQAALKQKEAALAMETSILRVVFPFKVGDKLPEGWEWKRIGRISLNIQYGLTTSATKTDTGIRFVRITDIINSDICWESVPFCECSKNDYQKYKLEQGDILFARTGATTGKSCLVDKNTDAVFASYLIRLQLEDDIYPEFVNMYFHSDSYWNSIMQGSRGGTLDGFNASMLYELQIPLLIDKTKQIELTNGIKKKLEKNIELNEIISNRLNAIKSLPTSILRETFKEV